MREAIDTARVTMTTHKSLFVDINLETLLPAPMAEVLQSYKNDLITVKALETEFMCLQAIVKAKPGSRSLPDKLRNYTAGLASYSKGLWTQSIHEDSVALISGYLNEAGTASKAKAKRKSQEENSDSDGDPSEGEESDQEPQQKLAKTGQGHKAKPNKGKEKKEKDNEKKEKKEKKKDKKEKSKKAKGKKK